MRRNFQLMSRNTSLMMPPRQVHSVSVQRLQSDCASILDSRCKLRYERLIDFLVRREARLLHRQLIVSGCDHGRPTVRYLVVNYSVAAGSILGIRSARSIGGVSVVSAGLVRAC